MPIFLDYLKGCIDWETYGFEICGEAHDGVEALSMIETTFPDIILGVCDYIVKPFEKEELLLSLLKQKDNIDRAIEAIFGEDFHPYRAIHECETIADAQALIIDYYMQAIHHREKHVNEKSHQVVEMVGFNDVSYFSKSFKKYYGVTPKSFSTSGE